MEVIELMLTTWTITSKTQSVEQPGGQIWVQVCSISK